MHRSRSLPVLLVILALVACGGSGQEATTTARRDAAGWALWRPAPDALLGGATGVASDPSVRIDGSGYRMAYTTVDFAHADGIRTSIAIATSADGLEWEPVPNASGTPSALPGEVLRGSPGTWAENLEGPALWRRGSDWLLLASGYAEIPPPGSPAKGFPAALAAASAADGRDFELVPPNPVLEPTPDGFDHHAIYSPSLANWEGSLLMVYAGHNYQPSPQLGLRILAARSEDGGASWSKLPSAILQAADAPAWARDGVAEPDLVAGPDGRWYLFFTALQGDARAIGLALADSPLGPWLVREQPILRPRAGRYDEAGVLAPSVLIEGARVRLWYLGVDSAERYHIGYAEADWPLLDPVPPLPVSD